MHVETAKTIEVVTPHWDCM